MNRIHPKDPVQSDKVLHDQRNYFRSVSAAVLEARHDPEGEAGEEEAMAGGRRRTWTMRNNAARQMAVNFMPSRQHGTVRASGVRPEELQLLRQTSNAAGEGHAGDGERQADVIVREMEQDTVLMEDNPEAEDLRREALRELPQCLTMKRTVRAKISASVSLRSARRPVPFIKRLKYRLSFGIKRMHRRLKDVFFSVELWYDAIRSVEGHFGSAAGSYFYFLRSLFLTDVLLSALLLAFVVVPQALHDARAAPTTDATNTTAPAPTTVGGFVLDLLSGQGRFEDSLLFYGHYHSGDVAGSGYSMSFAYFFTMLALYIFFFLLLCIRTAWSYRRNFIETAGGLRHVFASKVFCGWDFGIATSAAAALNSRSVYNELKELLSEQSKRQPERTRCARLCRLALDAAVNVVVVALAGGILLLFWWLLDGRAGDAVAQPLYMAAVVTAVLTLCPLIFSRLVRLESYGPRASLYVTLARTYLVDAATVLLLLVFWFRREVRCWETMFGQEIYRLIVLDILFSVILIPLFEFVRGWIYMSWFPSAAVEFDTSYNSLGLLYNQALLWLGVLFSPLLAPVLALKMFLTFYVKRAVALRVCRPARKVWRAAQTQTVLNMLQLLSLFGTLLVIGYVFLGSTSQQCGPFQEYERVSAVLTEGVLGLSRHPTLAAVLAFVTRPGVIAFALIFLCVLAYYARGKALAQKSMVVILREMLLLEAKDKEFLLAAIAKVYNGEWMYSPKPDDSYSADNSHTWKYLHNENVRKPANAGFHFEYADSTPKAADGPAESRGAPSGHRPAAHRNTDRPTSHWSATNRQEEDGDTDSSFSWQGSSGYLHGERVPAANDRQQEKKWL